MSTAIEASGGSVNDRRELDRPQQSTGYRPDAASTSAREILRRATDAVHRRLHDEPLHAAIVAGTIDRSRLRRLYGRLHGFHHPLEQRLRHSPHALGCGLDLRVRERAALLHSDLACLGLSTPDIERLPACPELPELNSAAALIGCTYVLDGSRLGGKVLAKALAPLFPGEPLAGRRFFLGAGDGTGQLWRETCAAVERCGTEPGLLQDMVRSARATFELLEWWLAADAQHRETRDVR